MSTEHPPLVTAAQRGDHARARELLRAGHDVDRAGPFGLTALHAAVLAEDLAMVSLLVEAGARVDLPIRVEPEETGGYVGPGVTALSLAARAAAECAARLAWDALGRLGARGNVAQIAALQGLSGLDALFSQLPGLSADPGAVGDVELLAALREELAGSDAVLAASRTARIAAAVADGAGASAPRELDRAQACGRWAIVGVRLRDGWYHGREALGDLGWSTTALELREDGTYRAVLGDGAAREGVWDLDGPLLSLDGGEPARFDRHLARLELVVEVDGHLRTLWLERG